MALMRDRDVYVNVHNGGFQNWAIWDQIASGLPTTEIAVTSLVHYATLGSWSSGSSYFFLFLWFQKFNTYDDNTQKTMYYLIILDFHMTL